MLEVNSVFVLQYTQRGGTYAISLVAEDFYEAIEKFYEAFEQADLLSVTVSEPVCI
jgi:hypothetical protein